MVDSTLIGVAGSISSDAVDFALIPHEFKVEPRFEGYRIKLTWSVPDPLQYPDWGRRLRILRKTKEWSLGPFDPTATVISDRLSSSSADEEYTDTDLVPGKTYYYSLYELRSDGIWVHDIDEDRQSAYPYDRWGCDEYLYASLPRGWVSADEPSHDLRDFMSIIGAVADGIKTDCEQLLSLFDIDEIHEDLLHLLERKVDWPGWKTAGGIARRKELKNAAPLIRIRGTRSSIEQLLEQTTQWNADVHPGWKNVFFTNGRFGSTTPDLSSPASIAEILEKQDTSGDILKYTNSNYGWKSVGGLLLELTPIAGISEVLSDAMVSRWEQMLEWTLGTWVTYEISIIDVP